MTTTRLQTRLCPKCGYTLDAADPVNDPTAKPKPDRPS